MAKAKAKSINHKKAHGGKISGGSFDTAPGNAADTGTPVSGAPTNKYLPPDLISAPRQPIGAGYGQSGGVGLNNPSAIPGDTQLLSPLAQVLKQDGTDGTLDKIIAGGKESAVDDQLRVVDDTPYPSAHGQVSRQASSGSPGGMIPAKIGALDANFVARRDAALKNVG